MRCCASAGSRSPFHAARSLAQAENRSEKEQRGRRRTRRAGGRCWGGLLPSRHFVRQWVWRAAEAVGGALWKSINPELGLAARATGQLGGSCQRAGVLAGRALQPCPFDSSSSRLWTWLAGAGGRRDAHRPRVAPSAATRPVDAGGRRPWAIHARSRVEAAPNQIGKHATRTAAPCACQRPWGAARTLSLPPPLVTRKLSQMPQQLRIGESCNVPLHTRFYLREAKPNFCKITNFLHFINYIFFATLYVLIYSGVLRPL